MPQCPHCGFVPQFRPAGGMCPWCAKRMCTPGCIVVPFWIVVILGLVAVFFGR